MISELSITIAVIAVELALFAFVIFKGSRKPQLNQIRLFPYRAASVVLVVLMLVTTAHAVSLVTGTPVKGRTMMKGQH